MSHSDTTAQSIRFVTVVGLEIHVQLQTDSKLFCGCSTRFGAEPNTQTCPVCMGAPGALPVLNRKAIDLSIKTGIALNCEIEKSTKWDRKNYFYPDLPKGYQISQLEKPICGPGFVDVIDPLGKHPDCRVRLERAHLEEDAGKSIHDESNQGGSSRIDLNRTGTPLLEIVTRPDLRSGREAKAFLTELKLILQNLSVSDCNMQQGNLRVDANVNIHVYEETEQTHATPIVEVKNLNSFRAVERAIDYETTRQIEKWKTDGLTIGEAPKQTRGWNDQLGKTAIQREKEEAADYRYFPDPDLVVVQTSDELIAEIRQTVGELPTVTRARIATEHRIPPYDADVIVNQGHEFVRYFEETNQVVGNGKLVSNWLQQELLRFLNENDLTIAEFSMDSRRFAELLELVANKQLDQSRAKDVFGEMAIKNITAIEAMKNLGFESISNNEIESICNQIIAENQSAVTQIKDGNAKAIGALIGKARGMNSNVNPGDVRQCLIRLIQDDSAN